MENLDNFLNTKVSLDKEEVKIVDVIKYSLDPFYLLYFPARAIGTVLGVSGSVYTSSHK